jgi:hypothetical protein
MRIGKIEPAGGDRHTCVTTRAFSQMGDVAYGLDDAGKHDEHPEWS